MDTSTTKYIQNEEMNSMLRDCQKVLTKLKSLEETVCNVESSASSGAVAWMAESDKLDEDVFRRCQPFVRQQQYKGQFEKSFVCDKGRTYPSFMIRSADDIYADDG